MVLDLDRGEQVRDFVVTGCAVGRVQPRREVAGDRQLGQPRPPVRHRETSPKRSSPDRRTRSSRWRSLRTAPGWRRSAPVNFDSGSWRPRVTAALGNFHASGNVAELVVGEGESAAVATIESPDESVTVERIDLATGEGVEVADGLHFQPYNMGPLISADLHVAAGLDDEIRTHVIDLDTGADVELGRCEVVRALDHSGRLALVDGQILCETSARSGGAAGTRCQQPRARPAHRRARSLDLGTQDMWSRSLRPAGRRRPPRSRRRASNNDSTVEVYRLPAGELLGSYTSTDGFPHGRRVHGRRPSPGGDQGHRPARRDRPRPARRRSRGRSGVDGGRPHRQRDATSPPRPAG